jgi:hypothetical protein
MKFAILVAAAFATAIPENHLAILEKRGRCRWCNLYCRVQTPGCGY